MSRNRIYGKMLAAIAAVACSIGGLWANGPGDPAGLADPGFLEVGDELEMIGGDPGGLPYRVVVAAPRSAITGPAAGVLLVARRHRELNVVRGETVRFISGLREAVWFAGRGQVGSSLAVLEDNDAGTATPLGNDRMVRRAMAPKILHGRIAVDVIFDEVGEHTIHMVIRVASDPAEGRAIRRSRRVPYSVTVWEPGELGSVSGSLMDESSGQPLAGMRVVALDAGTGRPVAAGISGPDGEYRVRRLPPGDYLIAVQGSRGFTGEYYDDAVDPAFASVVGVAAGTETSGIDFLLARP